MNNRMNANHRTSGRAVYSPASQLGNVVLAPDFVPACACAADLVAAMKPKWLSRNNVYSYIIENLVGQPKEGFRVNRLFLDAP
jgi:hypothetical protein